jgi:hypothetical protein
MGRSAVPGRHEVKSTTTHFGEWLAGVRRRGFKPHRHALSPRLLVLPIVLLALLAISATPAFAAPIWHVVSEAQPTAFQESDGLGNDEYEVALQNIGSSESSGTVKIVDQLPAGVTTTASPYTLSGAGSSGWQCSEGAGQTVVECITTNALPPATGAYNTTLTASPYSIAVIQIPVTVANGTPAQMATNTVTVSGGGSVNPDTASPTNPIDDGPISTFGTSFFGFDVIGPAGEPFTQAGGHPYAVSTEFEYNRELDPGATETAVDHSEEYRDVSAGEEAKTIVAELPLGLIGNPQAAPRCAQSQFTNPSGDNISGCPADTRVGIIYFQKAAGLIFPYQLFNLVPTAGHAAEFGFVFASVGITIYGDVVHSSRGYTLRITATVPQAFISAVNLVFFGDPAAAFDTGEVETPPFLTNPVDCEANDEARELQVHIDRWTHPGLGDPFNGDFADPNWLPVSATLPPVEGCQALSFDPSLSFQPASSAEGGTTTADEPSGYNVDLKVPQTEEYGELATPELKTATVMLPQGISVSSSGANGLLACSNQQIALESDEPASCPLSSQIGTAKITTPLLEGVLEGEVFLGEPECAPCTEADASDGRIFRLFIQVHSEKLGITIKLPGTVKANPATGQLTAEFKENPQLPFSDLEVNFKNGPRGPLANPQTCGTFTTVSDLEPWSSPETATKSSESPFAISGCGSPLPFAPAFSAGTASPAAGAFSPFSVTFSRDDGEQDLGGITVTTPPGLLGKIAGIPRCGEAAANAGTCSPESQIGTATVTAGPGSDPYTISGGHVYLTDSYKDEPFGLSIVVPAVAGPFNLGNVVVRASIAINPTTAALTITSNPLPQIVDGVPIRLRSATVEVNREDFMFNATNCAQQPIAATLTGEHPIGSGEADESNSASSTYAASGCASLPFAPKLTASAAGHGSKADGTSFDVKLESAGVGQADIAKVDLELPKALSSRNSTLKEACLEAVFAANPAACPEGSVIGKAAIQTPVLNSALSGPAYLVSHGGAAFPDVEFVLQGEGITLILDGKTDIKEGITYSRFEATPDAPFTTFETELPAGPHSIFTTNVPEKDDFSLCGKTSLEMPTIISGQNGAQIRQTTKVAVAGCKAAKPLTRAQLRAKALKTCRQDHKRSKKKRVSCERQARKRYASLISKTKVHPTRTKGAR